MVAVKGRLSRARMVGQGGLASTARRGPLRQIDLFCAPCPMNTGDPAATPNGGSVRVLHEFPVTQRDAVCRSSRCAASARRGVTCLEAAAGMRVDDASERPGRPVMPDPA
jgi:hypothetical protein